MPRSNTVMRCCGTVVCALLLCLGGSGAAQTLNNPPMPGFNSAGSDARAVEIADQVMEALGGRKNWDDTHYIVWRFFGRRLHVWDKWRNTDRVEFGNMVIVVNLNDQTGRAWRDGQEITDPDSLKPLLERGRRAWINDAYWMFMPYKLKDTGVTLKYIGEGKMQDGRDADVLQLTFSGVGVTPENKYRVYVDRKTALVGQWDYFQTAGDDKPGMSTPWENWQRFGSILLSDSRGGQRKHTDIAVYSSVPASVFEDPAPVKVAALQQAAGKN